MSTVPSAMPFLVSASSLAPTRREAWRDLHRQAGEALREGLEVLARQQRRRHHDRHLEAFHRRDEGGAQRHLGLAEADIAADQPVHRPAERQIVEHRVDGASAGRRSPHRGSARRIRRRARPAASSAGAARIWRSAAMRISWPAMSSRRFFSLALRDCQATPPSLSSVGLGAVRAVARQQLDVLDRQEQPVVAGIVDLEAVMRRAGRLDRLQADEAADAVVGMDDDVAGRERRRLGDEVGGALALLRAAHQPVAENVLLGDDDQAVGLEAGFERQHGKRRLRRLELLERRPACATRFEIAELVLGQNLRQPVERAFGPAGDDDAALARRARRRCA